MNNNNFACVSSTTRRWIWLKEDQARASKLRARAQSVFPIPDSYTLNEIHSDTDLSSLDLAMSGRAVRLDIVSRLSLSSSSSTVPSGLCKCGGTIGVDVAVVCTANDAGRFGDGTPLATPLRSNTGAEWMENSEPSCAAGWLFMFSSIIALPATTISWDPVVAALVSTSASTLADARQASWKLHSRGSDMFPRRLPRRNRGDRNTLDCVCLVGRSEVYLLDLVWSSNGFSSFFPLTSWHGLVHGLFAFSSPLAGGTGLSLLRFHLFTLSVSWRCHVYITTG